MLETIKRKSNRQIELLGISKDGKSRYAMPLIGMDLTPYTYDELDDFGNITEAYQANASKERTVRSCDTMNTVFSIAHRLVTVDWKEFNYSDNVLNAVKAFNDADDIEIRRAVVAEIRRLSGIGTFRMSRKTYNNFLFELKNRMRTEETGNHTVREMDEKVVFQGIIAYCVKFLEMHVVRNDDVIDTYTTSEVMDGVFEPSVQ